MAPLCAVPLAYSDPAGRQVAASQPMTNGGWLRGFSGQVVGQLRAVGCAGENGVRADEALDAEVGAYVLGHGGVVARLNPKAGAAVVPHDVTHPLQRGDDLPLFTRRRHALEQVAETRR